MKPHGYALVVLVLWSSPAWGEPPREIQQATTLLRQVREEDAIQVLTRALDRGDGTAAERAQLYVLLGLARFNLRDTDGARIAFRRALEADEKATLPKIASPPARNAFKDARIEVERERAAAPPSIAPPPVVVVPAAPAPAIPPPVEVKQPPPDPFARRVGGAVVVAVGAGLGGAALYFRQTALDGRADAQAQPDATVATARLRSAQQSYVVAQALGVGAGIAAVAGLALLLWPASQSSPGVAMSPGGVIVTARF